MPNMPKIYVLGTGGTIAGAGASATTAAYESGRIEAAELVTAVDGLEQVAEIQTENLFATGSENLGPVQWRKLARRIEELTVDADIDGVVVTHGTDTLEEAAFFLELVCQPKKPVVLTAAMRPGTALSADGPANLFQAALSVASLQLRDHGILIAMNGLVFPGWQALKTDSVALDSFRAYPGGPVGRISGERLLVFGGPSRSPLAGRFHEHLRNENELPHVDLVLLRGGCGVRTLDDWGRTACKGLVIAGFGAGTMPDSLVAQITGMVRSDCVVVVSSRVSQVTVMPETMTPVQGDNVVPSGILNPQKSALLLSLALDAGLPAPEIAKLFQTFSTRNE
jgi:L-asparaginase type II